MLNFNMRIFVGGLILIALITVGGFFWYRNRAITNTEPVRIYKATTTRQPSTPVIEKTEVEESRPLSETMAVDSDTYDAALHSDESFTDTSSDETDTPFSEIGSEPETLTDESDKDGFTETVTDTEAIAESLLEEWSSFIEGLRYKYTLLSMSQDEIIELAQSPAGRRELRSQAQGIGEDTTNYLVRTLSQYTADEAEEILRQAEEQVQQENYGIPPEYIEQAFERVRERLN